MIVHDEAESDPATTPSKDGTLIVRQVGEGATFCLWVFIYLFIYFIFFKFYIFVFHHLFVHSSIPCVHFMFLFNRICLIFWPMYFMNTEKSLC